MGMFNRWDGVSIPSDWNSTHVQDDTKATDWHKWKIATHPFCDLLLLFAEGDVTANQVTQIFDLSTAEATQITEMYQAFLSEAVQGHAANSVEARRVNIARLRAILGSWERGQPQQLGVDGATNTWLYNKFGITTADDR